MMSTTWWNQQNSNHDCNDTKRIIKTMEHKINVAWQQNEKRRLGNVCQQFPTSNRIINVFLLFCHHPGGIYLSRTWGKSTYHTGNENLFSRLKWKYKLKYKTIGRENLKQSSNFLDIKMFYQNDCYFLHCVTTNPKGQENGKSHDYTSSSLTQNS